jgi:pimeloyl-ACP methyl ester carboxylesterase
MLAANACSSPTIRFDTEAAHLGYTRTVVRGTEFLHVAYLKSKQQAKEAVHVYLEGDGLPWINHSFVARDPTPRDALMLRLMQLDPAPSILLGRPCYHGMSDTPPCSPIFWIQARYSEPVVASMAAALDRLLGVTHKHGVVFLGYSGGGVLAMLLAERFPSSLGLVTIAANLDIAAWTRYHGYTGLTGSLNPAERPPLRPTIVQLHLAGVRDANVPPDLSYSVIARQHRARFYRLENYDHRCCWEAIWPLILSRIRG